MEFTGPSDLLGGYENYLRALAEMNFFLLRDVFTNVPRILEMLGRRPM